VASVLLPEAVASAPLTADFLTDNSTKTMTSLVHLDSRKHFRLGGRSLNHPTHWMFRVWFRSWFWARPMLSKGSQWFPQPSCPALGGPRGQGAGGSDPGFCAAGPPKTPRIVLKLCFELPGSLPPVP
jgi:hypothetical protein